MKLNLAKVKQSQSIQFYKNWNSVLFYIYSKEKWLVQLRMLVPIFSHKQEQRVKTDFKITVFRSYRGWERGLWGFICAGCLYSCQERRPWLGHFLWMGEKKECNMCWEPTSIVLMLRQYLNITTVILLIQTNKQTNCSQHHFYRGKTLHQWEHLDSDFLKDLCVGKCGLGNLVLHSCKWYGRHMPITKN